jgi:hypothetical protein
VAATPLPYPTRGAANDGLDLQCVASQLTFEKLQRLALARVGIGRLKRVFNLKMPNFALESSSTPQLPVCLLGQRLLILKRHLLLNPAKIQHTAHC